MRERKREKKNKKKSTRQGGRKMRGKEDQPGEDTRRGEQGSEKQSTWLNAYLMFRVSVAGRGGGVSVWQGAVST